MSIKAMKSALEALTILNKTLHNKHFFALHHEITINARQELKRKTKRAIELLTLSLDKLEDQSLSPDWDAILVIEEQRRSIEHDKVIFSHKFVTAARAMENLASDLILMDEVEEGKLDKERVIQTCVDAKNTMQTRLHNAENEVATQKAKIRAVAGKSFFTPPVF